MLNQKRAPAGVLLALTVLVVGAVVLRSRRRVEVWHAAADPE